MTNKVVQLPKKSNNFIIKIGGKDVKLNFGLRFACEVDSYLALEAAEQGIDNLALIATRLSMRSPSTLVQLMTFSLLGSNVTEQELIDYVEAVADSGTDKYEALFDYFFTNLLASPSLSLKAKKAMPVVEQTRRLLKSQEEALMMGLTEITTEMELQIEAAKTTLIEPSEEADSVPQEK